MVAAICCLIIVIMLRFDSWYCRRRKRAVVLPQETLQAEDENSYAISSQIPLPPFPNITITRYPAVSSTHPSHSAGHTSSRRPDPPRSRYRSDLGLVIHNPEQDSGPVPRGRDRRAEGRERDSGWVHFASESTDELLPPYYSQMVNSHTTERR